MTQNDIDFIESERNTNDTRKITIVKLHKIYKTELGLKERRCFCSDSERKEFKITFYTWYENYKIND
jgi:hypothetical protein